MIPSPQYPLYSGTLAVLGGRRVDYLLNEEAQWGISAKDLEASYDHAVSQVNDCANNCAFECGLMLFALR